MKSIEIDEALYQYLASKAVANGEPVSAILRRELKLPAPLISVEIEEDMYSYVASKTKQFGESVSSILRRELSLDQGEHHDPKIVEFHIPLGTANKAWNVPEQPVLATVGDTLRVINDDAISHHVHTSGAPFPHPAAGIAPGGSADYLLMAPFDPGANQFLYDHEQGPAAQFWLKILPPH